MPPLKEQEKKRGRRGESERNEVVRRQPAVRAETPSRTTRAQAVGEKEADEPQLTAPPTRTQPLRGKDIGVKKTGSQVRDLCSMLCIGRGSRRVAEEGCAASPAQDAPGVSFKVEKKDADAPKSALPSTFKINFDPNNYVELCGDVAHEQGGMHADQYFREEIIRFKVPKGVKPGGEVGLAGKDVTVVGEKPEKRSTKRKKVLSCEEYESMKKEARSLMNKYAKLTGRRVTVCGDGWCWAYSLCTVMGGTLEHVKQVELADASQGANEATDEDKKLVNAFLEMMKVSLRGC